MLERKFEIHDKSSRNERFRIAENIARVNARYDFYAKLVRYLLIFLFMMAVLFVIKPIFIGSDGEKLSSARPSSQAPQQERGLSGNPVPKSNWSTSPAIPQQAPRQQPLVADKNRSGRIMLYPEPGFAARAISSLKDSSSLRIIQRGGLWTEVSQESGFPVWIDKSVATRSAGGQVEITPANAKAYSEPNTEIANVVGEIYRGDKLRLIRSDGNWYRVWSPSTFTAWVKTSELPPAD